MYWKEHDFSIGLLENATFLSASPSFVALLFFDHPK
jgi:hypothetical protein